MSSEEKFLRITKPVKFRNLRLKVRGIKSVIKELFNNIIYNIYNILYKLNIINRFYYGINGEEAVFGLLLNEKEVLSKYFRGTVKMNLVLSRDREQDYFYRKYKDGSKKILYIVKDTTETHLYAVSHLEGIQIKIDNTWYNVNSLPTFKAVILRRLKDSEKVCDTITYDVDKLRKLQFKQFIGNNVDPEDISTSRMTKQYYYGVACDMFEEKLESMKLSDLMI